MLDFMAWMKYRHHMAEAGYCLGFFPRDFAYFLTCLYAFIHFDEEGRC